MIFIVISLLLWHYWEIIYHNKIMEKIFTDTNTDLMSVFNCIYVYFGRIFGFLYWFLLFLVF